jgi:hypothetical protein
LWIKLGIVCIKDRPFMTFYIKCAYFKPYFKVTSFLPLIQGLVS